MEPGSALGLERGNRWARAFRRYRRPDAAPRSSSNNQIQDATAHGQEEPAYARLDGLQAPRILEQNDE